ncbi:hypothetical protein BK138_08430 [Paenibacillus rhizosphaerae]|uniref:Uncharacterized protein n=1 Tax=Paenibacillus rhizosphaerae TaxID=297318 RepID=A0A1R1F332_9BACL|nr:hypothetical protein [Paenibacillus rhizosphaerae]OMF58529.1 hypothetical protein BK138_08430 [Paenibacillus rhizosphaerae]
MNIGFDLGGFFGSFVGVLGAYRVAMWQIRKQREAEKPAKDRKAYVLATVLRQELNSAWDYFDAENFQIGELFRSVIQMIHKLQKHLPEAIESDKRLFSLITETCDGLTAISEKYSREKRTHENFMAYETELLTYTEFMRSKCDDLIKEIKERNKKDF